MYSSVRANNKSEYCRKCVCKVRELAIKDNELSIQLKDGRKSRAYKIVCPKCGKERLARQDAKYKSNLCKHCRTSEYFTALGLKWGGKNYLSGIGIYRRECLNKLKLKCLCCNKENKESIVFHHLDLNKKNNDIFNLIPLCKSCHRLIHNKIRKGIAPLEAYEQVKKQKTPLKNGEDLS